MERRDSEAVGHCGDFLVSSYIAKLHVEAYSAFLSMISKPF